ncbi:Uncharacterised protein [Mycobacteroides abscessus subsp. abscessus]|nr:Uncharacterised protein [Mycobacteroides abscessus subsp. abscessus]
MSSSLLVLPASRARRTLASETRYTDAAPPDSRSATNSTWSLSSGVIGPGTVSVRSAWVRKWSTGSGSALRIAASTCESTASGSVSDNATRPIEVSD